MRRRAGSRRRPPACPRAATLASAPAGKCRRKRAEQPATAENPSLPGTAGSSTLTLMQLTWLSFVRFFLIAEVGGSYQLSGIGSSGAPARLPARGHLGDRACPDVQGQLRLHFGISHLEVA